MSLESSAFKGRPATCGALFGSALIVLAGLAIYSPVFHGAWLPDDAIFVGDNYAVRSGSWARMLLLWLDPEVMDYFPLTYSIFWIQYSFFGLETTGYHLTTIIIHVANGLLLWALLKTMNVPSAWAAAFVFTIHPACVESVAWIAETKNTLSLFLFLASCILWVTQDGTAEGPRQKFLYVVSLVFFLLAMLAKPSVVAMPVVTLLHAWWNRGEIAARDMLHAVPFFMVSIVLGIVTIQFQHGRAIGPEILPIRGIDSRLAIAGMAIFFYLATILWPVNLMPIYPAWPVGPPRLWQFLPWLAIAAAGWCMWKHRNSWGRHAIFAFGFFLLMIAPVLGFLDMAFMRVSWVADHFLYVPMIGPLALTAATATTWLTPVGTRHRLAGFTMGGMVAMFLAGSSFLYAREWVDEERLWKYTLARNDESWFAHARTGTFKFAKGDLDGALVHFRRASQLRPDLGETKKCLGMVLLEQGDHDEAIRILEEATKASPWLFEIRVTLADAYRRGGRCEEARDLARELLQSDPTNASLRTTYAVALFENGEENLAIEELSKTLDLAPDFEPALKALERIRSGQGQPGRPFPTAPAT